MGVKRLQMYSGHEISLFCVCSEQSDIEYLKSKGIDYCVHDNRPLSAKFEYGFKQAIKKDFDYMLRLGSDDLLDHHIFSKYYNYLMKEGIDYFGMKTIGLVHYDSLDSCIYKYNTHRTDMILGGGSMLSKSLCLKFADIPLYNKRAINRGLDLASETEIKKHAKLVIVKTDKPMLIDVKSKTNIWDYRFTAQRMPKVDYSELTHFISQEEDSYLRRNTIKCIAVIPVKGRLPLLRVTIERLLNKNGCYKVICVGETKEERLTCEAAGAEFIEYENKPLGKKWNAGFLKAKEYNPDCCLFVGSSDWVSDNWIDYCTQYIKQYDLIGKPDFNLLDYGKELRLCHWTGYRDLRRQNEPIGIGRILSKRILDKLGWKPMDDKLDNSLDWSMYQKVLLHSGKIKLLRTDDIESLSLSTNKWENKHKFEDHWTGRIPSVRIKNTFEFLNTHFPEAFKLK